MIDDIKIFTFKQKEYFIASVSEFPNECIYCKRLIDPDLVAARQVQDSLQLERNIMLVFQCTNSDCRMLFEGFYYENDQSPGYFMLRKWGAKLYKKKLEFPELITKISPNYVKIYNQAFIGEENSLIDICGAGYRRALEFLVKDYIIYKKYGTEEEIQNKLLARCISEHIKDEDIKDMAKRAAWIGNDETHYFRIWKDKDLKDLKNLIELTKNFINNDLLKDSYKKDMSHN